MEELGMFITGVIIFGLIILGCWLPFSKHYELELHSVGIERIAHCSNAYSNWNEIVWIKKDYVK